MSGWRFLLDENIDPKAATYLEKEGISHLSVFDSQKESPGSIDTHLERLDRIFGSVGIFRKDTPCCVRVGTAYFCDSSGTTPYGF